MKKQTFDILPVSPEERKHLIGLSYNEIGDVLQEKDSLSLISYLNSIYPFFSRSSGVPAASASADSF